MLNGLRNYRNPVHIAVKRLMAGPETLMTISDRKSGVSVVASAQSYPVFGETWYARDYDVPGCPIRPGDVVLDIGAHQGFFSCYAAYWGAVVYAFEPFPDSFSRLVSNVERNGFASRVQAFRQAISDASGFATMRCFSHLGGCVNTIVETHARELRASTCVTVPTIDINAAIDMANGRIRLCKMDCEGSELAIVKALADRSNIESFALEFHPEAYPLCELIGTMLAWGTHQVSFSKDSNIVYAVANQCLRQHKGFWYATPDGR